MIRPIRTGTPAWIERHGDTHARHASFGTHRHPYLRDHISGLVTACGGGERPSLLDYGCGKGTLLAEMTRSGWFRFVRGYDPAVTAFKPRPAQRYDIVLCLDVLDQVEDAFVDAVIEDVNQFTTRAALFDVITVQTAELAHLNPRSAAAWQELIGRRMHLTNATVRPATDEELRQGACPERVIIAAEPRDTASRL